MIKEQLDFAKYIVQHNHSTANYYEDKKYKFLYLSVGILGFSVAFMRFIGDTPMLLLGATISIIFSFLSIAYYAMFSMPSYTSKTPSISKIENMSSKQILETYVDYAHTLQKLYVSKVKRIRVMGAFILLGILGFFICVLIYAGSVFQPV